MTDVNPSRVAEETSVRIVAKWVGDRGKVSAVGGHGPDFRIRYEHGRTGTGEVKVAFDKLQQAQLSALLRLPAPQAIVLPPGAGSWFASITPEASIKRLQVAIPVHISDLISHGLGKFDTRFSRHPVDLGDRLAGLGIEHLSIVPDALGEVCLLFTQVIAGMIPLDANAAIPWLHACFEDPRFGNSWARLEASTDNERHAFIWIDNGAPEELRLRVSFHPDTPPTQSPTTPPWLTHLWIGNSSSFTNGRWTWLYEPGEGWQSLAAD